jgi:ribosome biogenesis GTPase
VDNPGIREVQMWTDERTLRESFADVTELAVLCRFPDCSHGADHGCAIRAAVECGRLDAARHTAFLRLEEEIKDLKERGRKRQMTLERRARRDLRAVFRNRADREEGRGPRGKNRHWQR